MRILYIAVHSHQGWGAEYWLNKAFNEIGIETIRVDYREVKRNGQRLSQRLCEEAKKCDLLFLQRGEKLTPESFEQVTIPKVFWSTEPIQLKNDVDGLLESDIFDYVFVHSYSCLRRIEKEFGHLLPEVSVLHNAAPKDMLVTDDTERKRFAIFNRSISFRRWYWLLFSRKYFQRLQGRYGKEYFRDLQESKLAINVHFSRKNLDDFETGILEAMASGCAVVSETLEERALKDMGMLGAVVQVHSPLEMRRTLASMQRDSRLVEQYRTRSLEAIGKNTWNDRAVQLRFLFESLIKGESISIG